MSLMPLCFLVIDILFWIVIKQLFTLEGSLLQDDNDIYDKLVQCRAVCHAKLALADPLCKVKKSAEKNY